MKFCKYCGTQISDELEVCPNCKKSKESNTTDRAKQNIKLRYIFKNKKIWLLLAGVAVLIIAIFTNGKCHEPGCKNIAIQGKKYCYSHKCAVQSCNNRRFYTSNYCYSHHLLYDDDAENGQKHVSENDLDIKITSLYKSSAGGYIYAEGSITNNSDYTVSFVEIKGAFKDGTGTVIDTDWTYAVGSEGLEPGESKTWEMSVDYNRKIKNCTVSILDFDTD